MPQLDLFGAPESGDPSADAHAPVGLAPVDEQTREIAAKLPSTMRFGTSSWSFPGWEGMVWDRSVSSRVLARHGLGAYARHPLLRAVGVDRTFYGPMSADDLRTYARAVPGDFRFLVKAHEYCTLGRFPRHARYGNDRGKVNPFVLDPAYAIDQVVGPFVEGLGHKGGVLLFQFPPQDLGVFRGPHGFADRIHGFLRALPPGPRYAVELRTPALVTKRYGEALADTGTLHCVNALPGMPAVREQAGWSFVRDADMVVCRWMLAPGYDYAGAKEAFSPFDRLVRPDPGTRADIADLLLHAEAGRRPTITIVNNKAEGSSPVSILELVRALAARL